MTFDSLIYMLFLPTVVCVYWALRGRARTLLLLLASYWFYGAWDWRFLTLVWISTAIDYSVGLALGSTDNPKLRRLYVTCSICANLGLLGFFKYFNFFVDSAVTFMDAFGVHANRPALSIVLPVGISFYTFQTMSYGIDVYRKRMEPCRDLLAFATFVAFFPQLVAGPIERAHELLPQLAGERQPPSLKKILSALGLILRGLVLKVVVADQVASVADKAFGSASTAGSLLLVSGVVAFALQIYADFAAYTDVARGSARLFSVELIHNFRQPYLSRNITEFWHRWHISLSNWLRDYLYISIGGNRGGQGKTYRNLMTTMILGGLWHGASWNFLIWGTLHGGMLATHRLWRGRVDDIDALPKRPGEILSVIGTFTLVCFAWIFFRAATFPEAFAVIRGILSFRGPLPASEDLLLVGAALAATTLMDIVSRATPKLGFAMVARPVAFGTAAGVALVLLMLFAGAASVPFIYFQF